MALSEPGMTQSRIMALYLHVAPGLGEQQKEDRKKAPATQEEKPAFETCHLNYLRNHTENFRVY